MPEAPAARRPLKALRPTEASAFAAAQPAGARAVFLDVREPWEIAIASIDVPGADLRCMPMRDVPARLSELDPAQPVVCICHHGARSAQVVAFLQQSGFDQAYNLAGGIDAWSQDVDPGVARY